MKTIIHIKTEKTLKKQAADIAQRMGFSLSSVINGFLRHYVQTQELHLTAVARMTPYLEQVVEEARRDYENGVNLSGPYKTRRQVAQHLDKLMR